jgi:transcriptional regulator GlxA family with amidase domain
MLAMPENPSPETPDAPKSEAHQLHEGLYAEATQPAVVRDPQVSYQLEQARQSLPAIEATWPQEVQVLVAYLHEHLFEDDLTIEKARIACAVQGKNSAAVFRKYLERSPRQYLTHHRIEVARRLLERTSVSVTRVGLEVGFNSVSAFDKTFGQSVGCTPSEYRAQVKGQTSD